MRVLLTIFLALIYSFYLSSQEVKIIDASNNLDLIGATVKVISNNKESSYFTSNASGTVKIPLEQFKGNSSLLINVSYIGFEKIIDTLYKNQKLTIKLIPKPYALDNVTVTAQYAPTTIENSIHKIRVISRQKIEDMAAVSLKDVLTNELNVRISQDNILGSGMSLQGISGQNVKFMIDGVPIIGRLDGQIDLNQINLNDVERIEIVEGPLSVNYGSNALAGTINIITKKQSKEKFRLGVTSYNENIGHFNQEVNFNMRLKENQSIRLSIGRNYFDGWNSNDDFWPNFAKKWADSNRVQQWNPKEQYFGRIQYNFKYKEVLFTYKGEYLKEKITNLGVPNRSIISKSYYAFDDYYNTRRTDHAIFAQGKINDNWAINWTAAYNDFERIKEARRKDLVSLKSELIQETPTNDVQDTSTFNLMMSRGSIASTKDSTWINYEIGYDLNLESARGERIEGGEKFIGDYALFVTSEINVTDKLVIKPAARIIHNSLYDASLKYDFRLLDLKLFKVNIPVTPALNLKYKIENNTFRFSYAKGFRAPTLKELYFNFDDVNHSLFGNSDLKAERSDNISASISRKILIKEAIVKTEISMFYNKIYDQIGFAQSNFGGGDTLEYFNLLENKTKGLNLSFSTLYKNLTINLGASYTGRYNRLSESATIDDFSYYSEFVANTSYNIKSKNLTLALFLKHQGEVPGFGYNSNDEIVEQRIESFQLMDLTVSKNFLDKAIQLTLGIKNIFDVQSIQANLSGGGAHSGGGRSISVGTGRSVFVKVRFQIIKE